MSGRVLEGIRVLDLTRVVAGPFATGVLADLGADVVKLERPRTGDDYRYGPSQPGETSLSFQNTNRGKRSITLDLRTPAGRDLFLRLVPRFDVVVENFRAGWLQSQGLGPEAIQARHPGCLVASLSGFGQTGWRAGQASYDIVAQATGGLMAMTGFEDGPPVRGGGALADFVGGLYLALGVLAGLRDRDRDSNRRARVLDLSNQDAVFAITDSALTIFRGVGTRSQRLGNQHPFTVPSNAYEARDGWLVLATASNRLFRPLCAAIGRPELAGDPRFKSHRGRVLHREQLGAILAAWIAERSCDEVIAALGPAGADIPVARVEAAEDLAEDPQLRARGMIERHPLASGGEIFFHGNPLHFSGAEPRARALAPALGEHNAEVYAEIGLAAGDLERLAAEGVI